MKLKSAKALALPLVVSPLQGGRKKDEGKIKGRGGSNVKERKRVVGKKGQEMVGMGRAKERIARTRGREEKKRKEDDRKKFRLKIHKSP